MIMTRIFCQMHYF